MWYSIVISVLLVFCLILYFVLSKKLRMPTVATEVMITKYNKRIGKLERFCKVNKLQLEKERLCSKVVDDELNVENLLANVQAIQSIAQNFEGIEDVYVSADKNEAQKRIAALKSIAPLKIFASELESDKEIRGIFETFNIDFSKLNFEFQKYFGSQQYVNLGDQKCCFLNNDIMVLVDEKNIFEAKAGEFKLEIVNDNDENAGELSDVYKLKLCFNNVEIFTKKVIVDNEKVRKYLQKNRYFIKK